MNENSPFLIRSLFGSSLDLYARTHYFAWFYKSLKSYFAIVSWVRSFIVERLFTKARFSKRISDLDLREKALVAQTYFMQI